MNLNWPLGGILKAKNVLAAMCTWMDCWIRLDTVNDLLPPEVCGDHDRRGSRSQHWVRAIDRLSAAAGNDRFLTKHSISRCYRPCCEYYPSKCNKVLFECFGAMQNARGWSLKKILVHSPKNPKNLKNPKQIQNIHKNKKNH
jgi:hypothetical protein